MIRLYHDALGSTVEYPTHRERYYQRVTPEHWARIRDAYIKPKETFQEAREIREKHRAIQEREYILKHHQLGDSAKEIARALGRSDTFVRDMIARDGKEPPARKARKS